MYSGLVRLAGETLLTLVFEKRERRELTMETLIDVINLSNRSIHKCLKGILGL